MTLSEYLSAEDFDADMPGGSHGGTQVIPEGSRNATMSRFAGRVIKKYGDNDTAFQCFMEEADKCNPPLEQQELMTIWHSAQKFYAKVNSRTDMFLPNYTTMIRPISRTISPMSDRQKFWQSTSLGNYVILRQPTTSVTTAGTGRKPNPAHRLLLTN